MRRVRKRVGDGGSVGVWTDPWIPGTHLRRVLSPRREWNSYLRVSELMVEGGTRWDEAKVRDILLPFEQERVLAIPLSLRRVADSCCWNLEKDGNFLVRSAYRAILGVEDIEVASSSSEDKEVWRQIWKAPIIPRIKLFFGSSIGRHCLLRVELIIGRVVDSLLVRDAKVGRSQTFTFLGNTEWRRKFGVWWEWKKC